MLRLLLPLPFILTGCVSTGSEPPRRGTLTGFLAEVAQPGAIQQAENTMDDKKCREFGFQPSTDVYGQCRLQLEQIRATKEASRTPVRVRID